MLVAVHELRGQRLGPSDSGEALARNISSSLKGYDGIYCVTGTSENAEQSFMPDAVRD